MDRGLTGRAAAPPGRDEWNAPRYAGGAAGGHYESWFQRANHPQRPLAFWIRYTTFAADDRAGDALGELWAIFFDGERRKITTVKEVFPIADCRFGPSGIDVRIGEALLTDTQLVGSASTGAGCVSWSLSYESPEPPLLLLPEALYAKSFPKAKALVGSPNALFHGALVVDGERIGIEGWRGSQNHNWGSRHTDSYAWGQVAGFDDAPDAFLECSTAQVRIGPLWTPRLSLIVLRAAGREYRLNSLAQAFRARGRFALFDWRIESSAPDARITVHVHAPREAFTGLRYSNPPGGVKTCLNTKLATCEVTLERAGHARETFFTHHRAAFEILTDRVDHGIPVVV